MQGACPGRKHFWILPETSEEAHQYFQRPPELTHTNPEAYGRKEPQKISWSHHLSQRQEAAARPHWARRWRETPEPRGRREAGGYCLEGKGQTHCLLPAREKRGRGSLLQGSRVGGATREWGRGRPAQPARTWVGRPAAWVGGNTPEQPLEQGAMTLAPGTLASAASSTEPPVTPTHGELSGHWAQAPALAWGESSSSREGTSAPPPPGHPRHDPLAPLGAGNSDALGGSEAPCALQAYPLEPPAAGHASLVPASSAQWHRIGLPHPPPWHWLPCRWALWTRQRVWQEVAWPMLLVRVACASHRRCGQAGGEEAANDQLGGQRREPGGHGRAPVLMKGGGLARPVCSPRPLCPPPSLTLWNLVVEFLY